MNIQCYFTQNATKINSVQFQHRYTLVALIIIAEKSPTIEIFAPITLAVINATVRLC